MEELTCSCVCACDLLTGALCYGGVIQDGDGHISVQEIQKVFGQDNESAKKLIEEADLNKDGFISIDEFVTMYVRSVCICMYVCMCVCVYMDTGTLMFVATRRDLIALALLLSLTLIVPI